MSWRTKDSWQLFWTRPMIHSCGSESRNRRFFPNESNWISEALPRCSRTATYRTRWGHLKRWLRWRSRSSESIFVFRIAVHRRQPSCYRFRWRHFELLKAPHSPEDDWVQVKRIFDNACCWLTSSQDVLFGWQVTRVLDSIQVIEIALKVKVLFIDLWQRNFLVWMSSFDFHKSRHHGYPMACLLFRGIC